MSSKYAFSPMRIWTIEIQMACISTKAIQGWLRIFLSTNKLLM